VRILKQIAGAVLAGVAAALVLASWSPRLQAEPVLFDCHYLAELARRGATYRDAGADVEKTIGVFLSHEIPPTRPHGEALARELRRVWLEGKSEEEVAVAAFLRCQRQLGDMGRGI
jgi:hypothetical protein